MSPLDLLRARVGKQLTVGLLAFCRPKAVGRG
jgi:hypothetical protein